jgi:CheY-like chemotaxis protein
MVNATPMKNVKKILLVDDDEGFNYLNMISLQQNGVDCRVDIALNGKEALQYLLSSSDDCPDVILLDLNMPVMDGFEFLNKFEKQGAKCHTKSRVFVLSSSEREEDRYKTMSKTVVKGFFSKPLSPGDIREIMQ